MAWFLPQEFATIIAENAAPEFIQEDGNYRRVGALENLQQSTFELLQLSVTSHLAFGKNADQFPGEQCFTGRIERLQQGSRTIARTNRNDSE